MTNLGNRIRTQRQRTNAVADVAREAAKSWSKNYSDNIRDAVRSYVDNQITAAKAAMKTYVDGEIAKLADDNGLINNP